MRYRIPAPCPDTSERRHLDIVDPVRTDEARAIAEHGLCDVDAATHALLLALFDRHDGEVALVDLEPGVACLMCARLFASSTIVAVTQDRASTARLHEIASANGVAIDVHTDVASAIRSAPADQPLVVRFGAGTEISTSVDAIAAATPNALPPIVIAGGRHRSSWVTSAMATGYVVSPLRRFPSWRPLDEQSMEDRADGWLLLSTRASPELRALYSVWAGAVGACTPDRNDRRPFMAELRSSMRARETKGRVAELVLRDLSREAQAAWHRVDPWMPSPYSRAGRMVEQIVTRARRLLAGRSVPRQSASGHRDVGDDQRHAG